MAEERKGRRSPRTWLGEVLRIERLSPHMVRLVLGGTGLDGFEAGEFSDHYLKLLFGVEGVDYGEPFDLGRIREEFPREQWPRMRTYTVRRWDAAARELWVDFVVHGDRGLAAPWAERARPGDVLRFSGPGGGYAPDPDLDWHFLAGDESALPAIAASLERLAPGARAHAFVEIPGPEDELPVKTDGQVRLEWIHRGDTPPGRALVEAVSGFAFPAGDCDAFVHGEAGAVREIRRLVRFERGVPRERLSVSGYWRLGHDEDGWQAGKREWNRQDEEDEAART
ncbi:siderophore-interacting protein [Glycomyces salinus]|uniref:siderophore-interacting protein n=1 Tax=Glycomyces salinus TaxID=980294 RepID=UPI0018EB1899|nr:siderophore-interacting protein [Glycomyces salinus]